MEDGSPDLAVAGHGRQVEFAAALTVDVVDVDRGEPAVEWRCPAQSPSILNFHPSPSTGSLHL